MRKPLLPRAELDAMLEAYRGKKKYTTEELIEGMRKEWKWRWVVFGDRLLRLKKGGKAYNKAKKELCEKIIMIEQIGAILAERINKDGQLDMFNNNNK